MSDNIKVVVKVRPLISREVEEKLGDRWRVRSNTLIQLDLNGRETDISYTFDKVYDKQTRTQEVYDDVAKPIVEAAIEGFNGTIFAYGQTSSGKTYTMAGTRESPGIIPMAVQNIFDVIQKTHTNRDFLVRVSYIEIYNETLKDLLDIERRNIKIHETYDSGVKVDVTEKVTSSPDEVLEAMRMGEANRMTGATNMNEESSRSHSIFQITIESREHVEGEGDGGCVNVSQLNLVDLAGSERSGQTGATGLRFKEGTHINKSLSCLALVIKQLSDDPNRFVNFRDSKLTRILQNSLGGNAKTCIVCAVTPASVEETVSTLQFANRAKAIKNKPEVNVVATDATMIQELTQRLSRLQSELAAKKNLLESKNTVEQSLQKQIASLQKLILNGFGQRSSMDIVGVGARRKMAAPRRVTISTLHHIAEEPAHTVPKFCTPSLKYNPLALSTEFQPVQNNKLASVPEEARMITPPPLDTQPPTIHEVIIELDSDDDNNSTLNKSCSPYHVCYKSSKTPPCVLRKNARQAEKNLQDIVELTKREKIYTPSVVELMERQEQNAALINKLQEEMAALLEKSKEKDKRIDELESKVDKTEDQVKTITTAKMDLESEFKSKCKEYETQLTDWEVSYETLTKKSKTREEELLSLLEDHKERKVEEINKVSKSIDQFPLNIMDMSAVSLVSDNESSVTNAVESDSTPPVQDLVKDIQSQLAIKSQTILELETSISTQQLKIESLENSSQLLQMKVDEFKTKLSTVQTENDYLKSTINTLNSTIENQKAHLESTNKDIKSYNDTIRELQIKLNKKDVTMNIKLDESAIETMIANEQKVIANNDNIKNIIYSLKMALNNKTKEIDNLKTTIEANYELSTNNAFLKENIEIKERQINTLINEAQKLKDQLNENVVVINKLLEVEKVNNTLRDGIDVKEKEISTLKNETEKLKNQLKENIAVKDKLLQIEQENSGLKERIETKENKITSLTNEAENLKIQISEKISTIDKLLRVENDNDTLKEEIQVRENQITSLMNEAEKLNDQLSENIFVINKLMQLEQDLTGQLNSIQEQNETFHKINAEYTKVIESLKIDNENLIREVAEKTTFEQSMAKQNEELSQQIVSMTKRISDLERDLNEKDLVISSNNEEKQSPELVTRAQTILSKFNVALRRLNSNAEILPETVHNLEYVLNALVDKIDILEAAIIKVTEERDQGVQAVMELNKKITSTTDLHGSEVAVLQAQLSKVNDEFSVRMAQVLQEVTKITEELEATRSELDNKNQYINDLEIKLNNSKENKEKQYSELVTRAQTVLSKFNDALKRLNSNAEILPETVHNLENVLNALVDKVDILEAAIIKVTEERDQGVQAVMELNKKITSTTDLHGSEVAVLQAHLSKVHDEFSVRMAEALQEVTKITEELEATRSELDTKNQYIVDLKIKLNDSKENNENLRNDLLSKENSIAVLNGQLSEAIGQVETLKQDNSSQIECLHLSLEQEKRYLEKIIEEKGSQITLLEEKLSTVTYTIEGKFEEIISELKDTIENRDKVLVKILTKVSKLTEDFDIANNIQLENITENSYEQIVLTLDKIANHIVLLRTENDVERSDIEELLTNTKKEIENVTDKNIKLFDDCEKALNENKSLKIEIERVNTLNKKLMTTGDLLNQLNIELQSKTDQINIMEEKLTEWKDKYIQYEAVMTQQMSDVLSDNQKLKELHKSNQDKHNSQSGTSENYEPVSNSNFTYIQSRSSSENLDTRSPQSLLTICCNKIIDAIQPKEYEFGSLSTSSSRLDTQVSNGQTQTEYQPTISICKYENINKELNKAKEDISELNSIIEELEITNKYLLEEREEIRRDIQLLAEPANELRKKIVNHRTNLSTLTATTFAENKLLQSQLKVLKHHHTRYINVSQRDLPAFKTQLNELMTILKGSTFLADKHNASFKRYSLPDVLDSNTTISTFKNESILDGDLLMLDTNVTMTTADNTLVGHDQTCLEVTQMNFDNDACQTDETSKIIDPCLMSQIETLTKDNLKLVEQLQELKEENLRLNEEMQKSSAQSKTYIDASTFTTPHISRDMQSSPIKINGMANGTQTDHICTNCKELQSTEENLTKEVKSLKQTLEETETQRDYFKKKFNDLTLDVPSIDALTRKLANLEKDRQNKAHQMDKINYELNKKNKLLKELQEEYDTLSAQVMDNISEADDLKKELEALKGTNIKLTEKCKQLENLAKETENRNEPCIECAKKADVIKSLQSNHEHSKLNRSLSDSDSSSRYNTICTLQSELHASKEDCKKITEEVATIKNHLERSNISIGQAMDLDESMGDSNIFTFTKRLETEVVSKSKTTDGRPNDIYISDRMDCLKFYIDKTGADKENMDCNVKIIDVMKMLYNNLVSKHGNEVENLTNKLKHFEEVKSELQTQLNNASIEHSTVTKQLEESNNNIKTVTNLLNKIRANTNLIQQEMGHLTEFDKNAKLVNLFKENLLRVIDIDLGLSLVNTFELLIDNVVSKHQKDLAAVMEQYAKLQSHMENVVAEFNIVNENLKQMKSQLSDKENEYNLLKAQKEKVYEISNAVTLDIVNKERELTEILVAGCEKLVELEIIVPCDTQPTTLNENIKLLFDRIIQNQKNTNIAEERQHLIEELNNLKTILDDKEKTVNALNIKLTESEQNLQVKKTAYEDLVKLYENKDQENKANIEIITKINEDIEAIKETLVVKETFIKTFEESCKQKEDTAPKLENTLQELHNLKNINEMIIRERDYYSEELEKAREVIARNKADLDKMTADILVFRKSVNDNVSIVERLTLEAKSLMEQNVQLKTQFEEKDQDCSRLERNIKTHQKTAEIQSKIINRLQKQKEEDDKHIQEVTEKCAALQTECDTLKEELKTAKEEVDDLKTKKEALEAQISQVEVENVADVGQSAAAARRRRRSLYDSQRAFHEDAAHVHDHNKMEAVFESRAKPDDLFASVEEDGSNRSTPVRLSRGRDSLIGKDQSDIEEDSSRPSSVAQSRRRRQSIHDQHRASLAREPLLDHSAQKLGNELNHAKSDSTESEIVHLREKVAALQQEIEELSERNRELDEECEICGQYLQERDESIVRLKKEKTALEQQVAELNEKLKSPQNQTLHDVKPTYAHAFVNTDADWANLHSVVVDRMSFDAEVEKNKKLTRTIEELRCNKQELKNTISKMQRALEKNAGYSECRSGELMEMEATKEELASCKQKLAELQTRCRELENCSQNLHERDEQCRKLREAKLALESDKEEDSSRPSSVAQSRRRRQSIHDQHRASLAREPLLEYSAQKLGNELNHAKSDSTESEIIQLREKLAALQQANKELSERNRELDEECEICGQYLQERDESIVRLKKEKTALERQVAELNLKLKSPQNGTLLDVKPTYDHASVNTDTDWANLHSVVVDRMSFDAEVEKNKKLTRTIEELRCNKQELKNTISKMQRALEKNAAYKLTLEAKVRELQEASVRGRSPAPPSPPAPPSLAPPDHRTDSTTQITDDFLNNQVERDEGSAKGLSMYAQELKRVKTTLERVLKEKAALENELTAVTHSRPQPHAAPTVYVATGSAIVQNQQITDVMKENQKLKKVNAKLIAICKKRGKSFEANRENLEPSNLG